MVRALASADEQGAVLYINVAGLTNVAVANQSGCLFTRAAAGGLSAIVATLAERRALTLEHSRMWLATSASRRRWSRSRATPSWSPPPGPPSTRACTSWPTRSATRSTSTACRTTRRPSRARSSPAPPSSIPGFAEKLAEQLNLPVEIAVAAADEALEGVDPGRLTVAAGLAVEDR